MERSVDKKKIALFLLFAVFLFLIRLPWEIKVVWKVIDTGFWCLLLYLIWQLFTRRSTVMLAVTSVLILLFPMSQYMASEGYIATTPKYLYTVIALLAGIAPAIRSLRGESVRKRDLILAALSLVYAESQDQTAVIAIVFFLLMGVKKIRLCWGFFIYSLVVGILLLFIPGHIVFDITGALDPGILPDFQEWPVWYKGIRGICTTFANLFFYQPAVFLLYLFAQVFYLLLKGAKKSGILLGIIALAMYVFPMDRLVIVYEYAYGMPDLLPGRVNPAGVLLGAGVFAALVLAALRIGKIDTELGIRLFLLNILGFGSRFMMGLSPMLYMASYATFTAQLFCFIICDILLVEKILKMLSERGKENE